MKILVAPAELLGSTLPRIWTEPAVTGPPGLCGCGCALTPATSAGYSAVEFAHEVLGVQLLPWQRWFLIHALELRPDGRFRFRTVLTLVARQNGKTTICKILALWFLYVRGSRLVLGCAQALNIATEAWQGAVELATENAELAAEIDTVRKTNGQNCLSLTSGARYLITAASRSAGRGLAVDGLLLLDELREQRDWDAWGALSKTTMAQRSPLTVCITNQGDEQSVVLNALRSAAMAGTDEQLFLAEWSAEEGCSLDDERGWAQANPGLGHTIDAAAIRAARGTDPAATFRTEVLCQRVDVLDAAVDPEGWRACADPATTLAGELSNLVMCVDVAMGSGHVTAAAAAQLEDGTVLCEVFDQWESVAAARIGLRQAFETYQPRACAWFPSGPAAVIGAELREQHCVNIGMQVLDPADLPPEAPGVVAWSGEHASAACQTLASLVVDRKVRHPDDPLLNAQILTAVRKDMGDGWRFARRGAGDNDAAYAVAGAVHLARSIPRRPDYDVLDSVF